MNHVEPAVLVVEPVICPWPMDAGSWPGVALKDPSEALALINAALGPSSWVDYNDLITTSPQMMVSKVNDPYLWPYSVSWERLWEKFYLIVSQTI